MESGQSAALKLQRAVPRPPRLPTPPIENLFCSCQTSIEDVHIHTFDVANGSYGLCGYLGTLSAMKYRQLTWSPLTICNIPVTPLKNPKTGFPSFFIIRLIDSSDKRYEVDLLFRDTDLYFVGFRRRVLLNLEEEVQGSTEERNADPKPEAKGSRKQGSANSKKAGRKNKMTAKDAAKAAAKAAFAETKVGWGKWHEFEEKDMELPSFFNATKSKMTSSYDSERVTAGGIQTFKEILFVLGTYDDGTVPEDSLQRACFSVMVMLSEASRLRCVFKEVVHRIVHSWSAQGLNQELNENIDNWTQMGQKILQARLDGKLEFKTELDKKFVEKLNLVKDRKHIVKVLGDLIDEHIGEVLLINSNIELLGFTESEIEEISDQAKRRPMGGPAGRKEADFNHERI